jgi:hypothetical protein
MIPSRFQAPPTPEPLELSASHSTSAAPPAIFTRFSLPEAKKATERLSGDQNGKFPFSVPGNGRALNESSGRSHNKGAAAPSDCAPNTTYRPSGEAAVAAKMFTKWVDAGASIGNRVARVSGAGARCQKNVTTASAAMAAPATAHGNQPSRDREGAASTSSSSHTSPMSRSRFFGSFSRHRVNSRRTFGGAALRSGCFMTTAASVSVRSSPWNSRWPVTISYSTTPNAQMSARLSTFFPFACSGAM